MSGAARLDPAQHDWLRDPALARVFDALDAVEPGAARLVGGCVRNALINAPVEDIDIATQLDPDTVRSALKAAGIKAVPTGIEHGTITAVIEGRPFEITSLRKDVETDGRRAVIAFTRDWNEDAQRRDFRLNALYAERDGTIHDPAGGLADLEARRFVFIGRAEDRIQEDYLRILRFFRFHARYGAELDETGLAACRALRDGLNRLSAERIWSEFKKILGAPGAYEAVAAMEAAQILEILLGPKASLTVFGGIIAQDTDENLVPDPLLRLAALTGTGPGGRERIRVMAAKMKMSNAERERLFGATDDSAREDVKSAFGDLAAAERAIMALGAQAFSDQVRLEAAEAAGETAPPPRDWKILTDYARNWDQPDFPVTGGDLILLGYEPGPMLGDALDQLKAHWIAERFEPTKEDLLARLKQ